MGIQTLNEDQCKLYGAVHQVAVLVRLADDAAGRLIIINSGGISPPYPARPSSSWAIGACARPGGRSCTSSAPGGASWPSPASYLRHLLAD